MDSITQQNSATSEEAASASEELASQAQCYRHCFPFRFDASNTKPAASVKQPSTHPGLQISKQLGWHTDDEFKEIHITNFSHPADSVTIRGSGLDDFFLHSDSSRYPFGHPLRKPSFPALCHLLVSVEKYDMDRQNPVSVVSGPAWGRQDGCLTPPAHRKIPF